MTAATALADELLGLVDHQRDHIDDSRPQREAARQADHKSEVQAVAPAFVSRLQDATVFSIIVVTQMAWIVAVAYALSRFLS